MQPTANYWTDDVKSATRCRLLNPWPRKPGDKIVLYLVYGKYKEQNDETPLRMGKYFEWIIKQLLNSAFIGYEEFCGSQRMLSTSVDNTLLDLQNSYRTQPHSVIANYIDILMTAFLMISKDFQSLSEDFRKLFLRPEKCSQTFSETFQRLPKNQRCHFDRTPTNLLV